MKATKLTAKEEIRQTASAAGWELVEGYSTGSEPFTDYEGYEDWFVRGTNSVLVIYNEVDAVNKAAVFDRVDTIQIIAENRRRERVLAVLRKDPQ